MRFAILTSTGLRHRYVANTLRRRLDVAAIGYESTGYSPADASLREGMSIEDRAIVDTHYEDRERQEERYFGHDAANVDSSDACAAHNIAPGALNTLETLRSLEDRGVEAVIVYGTNLIREPLVSRYAGRMINMHLGLSPYYRGTATNFYPLLNDEPEYVGATIHLIDPGIDSGAIIHHARPVIVADDGPHTIGCKAILAGLEKLADAAMELQAGTLRTVAQWAVPNPRLILRKDFHPRHVVELHCKLADGLIPRYVERAAVVAPRVRLVP